MHCFNNSLFLKADIKNGCNTDNLLLMSVCLSPREGPDPAGHSALGRPTELWQKEHSGISMALGGTLLISH